MKKSFWLFLILSAALVIFSVQNAGVVDVNFFFKEVTVSLAVLLIIVFLSGVLAGASWFFFKSKKNPHAEKTSKSEDTTVGENSNEYAEN